MVLDFEQEAAETTEMFFSVLSGFLLFKSRLPSVPGFRQRHSP